MVNYNLHVGLFSSKFTLLLATLAIVISAAVPTRAQEVVDKPEEFENVGIDEHVGDTIPLNLIFTDDRGRQVALEKYFRQDKPVMLALVYYTCPMLCNLILNGMVESMKGLDWTPGQEFQVVSVSFQPTETSLLASAKKKNYLKELGKPDVGDGWVFLTGAGDQSRALADAIGFKYRWDEENQQFAHASAIYLLTPDGKISRYLYGIEFPSRDVKLGLLEASEGKVGSTVDKIILYCYHYDPDAKGYVVFAGNVMRLGGAITLVLLVILLGTLWSRERIKKRRRAA